MSKALFFGGAFNPPTIAHLLASNAARLACQAEKVIFVPSQSHYILSTQGKDFSFSDEARLSMLRLLAKTRPWMAVSAYELEQPSQPRTYHSLQALSQEGYELKLLIGSDWLVNLKTSWKFVPEICKTYGIVVMSRNSQDSKAVVAADPYLKTLEPYLTFVQAPALTQQVSSSAIRKALASGTMTSDIQAMIPKELGDLRAYLPKREAL